MARNLLWILLYLACAATVVVIMFRARERALQDLSTARARDEWQAWKSEVERQQDGTGPVLRRAPRRDEPPELLLLRDHFITSLLGVLLLTSALFLTLMVMIRGAVAGPPFPQEAEQHSRAGPAPD